MISYFGAFVVSFCGLGPGGIFGTYLLYNEIDSMVAYSTAMYVTFFTTLTASIQSIFFNKFLYEHAFYVFIMTIFGTLPGLYFQKYARELTQRPSINVLCVALCTLIAMIIYLIFNVKRINHIEEISDPQFKMVGYCPA